MTTRTRHLWPDLEYLASSLRRRRERDELSLRDVERETGIGFATLSRVERRAGIADVLTLCRLSDYLGVRIENFFKYEEGL